MPHFPHFRRSGHFLGTKAAGAALGSLYRRGPVAATFACESLSLGKPLTTLKPFIYGFDTAGIEHRTGNVGSKRHCQKPRQATNLVGFVFLLSKHRTRFAPDSLFCHHLGPSSPRSMRRFAIKSASPFTTQIPASPVHHQ